jgi:DNA-binding CsgD family transcriptional regulator
LSRWHDLGHGDRESAIQAGSCLTHRRAQILELLAAGHAPKEIARLLQLALPTVHEQIQAVRHILGARNNAQLVARAVDLGFLPVGALERAHAVQPDPVEP